MILIGDIGNTDTKICLINSNYKIIKKLVLPTQKINNSLLFQNLYFEINPKRIISRHKFENNPMGIISNLHFFFSIHLELALGDEVVPGQLWENSGWDNMNANLISYALLERCFFWINYLKSQNFSRGLRPLDPR